MQNDNCIDCFYCGYVSGGVHFCKFYLMTNERRPCPSGDGCTVKVRKLFNWKSGWKKKKVKANV